MFLLIKINGDSYADDKNVNRSNAIVQYAP